MKAGDEIGGWKVVRFLGAGRCGAVYEVGATDGSRRGAMKVFSLTADSFERECVLGEERPAGVGMPGFYGSGRLADGTPYLVMELLERLPTDTETGELLTLGKRRLVPFFRALCTTVSRLHANGYIHCDIKPENILLRGESPVLSDYGTARTFDEASRTERRVGSWEYMAPEARDGLRIDARADVYSLGVLLGKLCDRRTRRTFEGLVCRATSNRPEDRPESVADFLRQLSACKDQLSRFRILAGTFILIASIYSVVASLSFLIRRTDLRSRCAALMNAEAVQRTTPSAR